MHPSSQHRPSQINASPGSWAPNFVIRFLSNSLLVSFAFIVALKRHLISYPDSSSIVWFDSLLLNIPSCL